MQECTKCSAGRTRNDFQLGIAASESTGKLFKLNLRVVRRASHTRHRRSLLYRTHIHTFTKRMNGCDKITEALYMQTLHTPDPHGAVVQIRFVFVDSRPLRTRVCSMLQLPHMKCVCVCVGRIVVYSFGGALVRMQFVGA